ncbi:MAG: hypothetical protein BAJALOKI3v1_50090 [Promethearchaeota archaeon]|nr:MAG: hypothetical protein BAJALOKI3v1_50090 [Candidatus Lokiarchaeota archaeon]
MKNQINWSNPKWDHAGKLPKEFDSLFNPGSKITWTQYIAELIIKNRVKYIKSYPKITIGNNWYHPINAEVRKLCQSASYIIKFFPHYKDNSSVIPAFRRYITSKPVFKLGMPKKSLVKKNGKANITQHEKDIILGVWSYIKDIESVKSKADIVDNKVCKKDSIKFDTGSVGKKKSGIRNLRNIEDGLSG